MELVGIIAVVLLAIVGLFHLALAFGAPWGAAAWGGAHQGVLPIGYRIASGLVGLFFYPGVILLVAGASGLTGEEAGKGSRVGLWILAGLFGAGALLNAVSRSKVERVWSPVALVTAICFGYLAMTS